MPRLRKVAGMCSSNITEMRICGYHAVVKILCRSLFSTLTQSTVCTQGSREKGRFTRGWKTAGCLPSCAPAARSGNSPLWFTAKLPARTGRTACAVRAYRTACAAVSVSAFRFAKGNNFARILTFGCAYAKMNRNKGVVGAERSAARQSQHTGEDAPLVLHEMTRLICSTRQMGLFLCLFSAG